MKNQQHLKENEDSGISSIRSSNQCELSAIEKFENMSQHQVKEDSTCSCTNENKSCNNINTSNDMSKIPEPSLSKFIQKSSFKRPCFVQ